MSVLAVSSFHGDAYADLQPSAGLPLGRVCSHLLVHKELLAELHKKWKSPWLYASTALQPLKHWHVVTIL